MLETEWYSKKLELKVLGRTILKELHIDCMLNSFAHSSNEFALELLEIISK